MCVRGNASTILPETSVNGFRSSMGLPAADACTLCPVDNTNGCDSAVEVSSSCYFAAVLAGFPVRARCCSTRGAGNSEGFN